VRAMRGAEDERNHDRCHDETLGHPVILPSLSDDRL